MKDIVKNCRIALVQGSPIMFNKAATLSKTLAQIAKAGRNGAQVIVFPESYIPCYPYGLTFGFTVGSRTAAGREDWKQYYDNALVVPGAETEQLRQAAKAAHAYVSLGITERDAVESTLYCTNLIFSPDGQLTAKHRKLKPTGSERYIWGDSHDPATYFPMVETLGGPWAASSAGKIICLWPGRPYIKKAIYLAPNTNDNPEWQDTIKHIAIEGHCYVINVDQYFTKAMYPVELHCQDEVAKLKDEVCLGGSCVIDPYGHYLTEPVWKQEAIIYADLDMDQVPMSHMEFDAAGHYCRPDVLQLTINDK